MVRDTSTITETSGFQTSSLPCVCLAGLSTVFHKYPPVPSLQLGNTSDKRSEGQLPAPQLTLQPRLLTPRSVNSLADTTWSGHFNATTTSANSLQDKASVLRPSSHPSQASKFRPDTHIHTHTPSSSRIIKAQASCPTTHPLKLSGYVWHTPASTSTPHPPLRAERADFFRIGFLRSFCSVQKPVLQSIQPPPPPRGH